MNDQKMYQFSLHCVDGTTELDIAFGPTHERPEQSENKQMSSLQDADLATNDSDRSIIDDRRNSSTKMGRSQRSEDRKTHAVPLFGSGAPLHDDLISLPSSLFHLLSSRHQLAKDVSDTSPTLSSSEYNEYHEHNIWNFMLELLFHTHIGISMEALFCEGRMGANRTSLSFRTGRPMRQRMSHLTKKKTPLDNVLNKPSRT